MGFVVVFCLSREKSLLAVKDYRRIYDRLSDLAEWMRIVTIHEVPDTRC